MEHPEDDRPFGWGVCSICGFDAEEADYNPQTRESVHLDCAVARYQALEMAEGLDDDARELLALKDML